MLAMSLTTAPQARKLRSVKSIPAKTANHAKLVAAISSLEGAKSDLEHSKKDFGGHKRDALEAINNALKQLRLALQFEKY